MAFRNSITGEYPITHNVIRKNNPNISFPKYFENFQGYDWVNFTDKPEFNHLTHYCEEDYPIYKDGKWYQNWIIKQLDTPIDVSSLENKFNQFVSITQNRLDSFAKIKNYDNMVTACSYIHSSIEEFKNDANRCIELRDLTWVNLFQIFDEIRNGIRNIPSYYEEIEVDLPELVW